MTEFVKNDLPAATRCRLLSGNLLKPELRPTSFLIQSFWLCKPSWSFFLLHIFHPLPSDASTMDKREHFDGNVGNIINVGKTLSK